MRPERRTARAHLGAAEAEARRNPSPANQSRVAELRQNYKVLRLEDYIREVVDSAPPLTEAQRARIAALLHGGDAA